MRILTDFPRFPRHWKTATMQGDARTSLAGASFRDLFRLIPEIRQADLILLSEGTSKVFSVVLFFCLMPFLRKPIVVVDLLLRKPNTLKQKVLARFKRLLLNRVDHFVNYFKALEGYHEFYGISPARSSYVPFKSNNFRNPRVADIASSGTEEYVFTAGRSLRDYDTFFEAISKLDYPAAIPKPNFEQLRRHGARFTWRVENLPRNLVILEDDGTPDSWIRNMCKARIVVIPALRDDFRPMGIGTYLDAMLLKKCVIISSAPGVSDVLTDQALIVPPEDPAALAQAIRKVWANPALREEIAARGQRYAESLGGEPELMQRILESVVTWYSNRS